MSLVPSPSVSRGSIILQPSYFTSSLFVNPLREDILHLIHLYTDQYMRTQPRQPFTLFKTLWNGLGWTWFHFKVFDAKTRETFLQVTARLFLEHMAETQAPLSRVVALFGLYTFYYTQPSTSTPALYSIKHVPIATDVYKATLALPSALTAPHLLPIQSYATYILRTLLDAKIFYVLPASALRPHNPCVLPREIFLHDGASATSHEHLSTAGSSHSTPIPEIPAKKRGRPSKRDRVKKARDAVVALDKWLDKTAFPPVVRGNLAVQLQADPRFATQQPPTHILIMNPPTTTLENYRSQKQYLMETLTLPSDNVASTSSDPSRGQMALERANNAILTRLKKIDQMAAEQGLEVGGEGGERTGLTRVEKAVKEMERPFLAGQVGGILGLVDGAGLEDPMEVGDESGTAFLDRESQGDVPMVVVQESSES